MDRQVGDGRNGAWVGKWRGIEGRNLRVGGGRWMTKIRRSLGQLSVREMNRACGDVQYALTSLDRLASDENVFLLVFACSVGAGVCCVAIVTTSCQLNVY